MPTRRSASSIHRHARLFRPRVWHHALFAHRAYPSALFMTRRGDCRPVWEGLAAVLAVVALAGCGSSSSSPTTTASATTTETTATTATTAPALTRQQFATKLDDICKRGDTAEKRLEAAYAKAADAGDYAKAASLNEQVNRLAVPFNAEVAKLVPPASEQAAFERYMTANRRLVGVRQRLAAALRARDAETITQLQDVGNTEVKARTVAAIDLGTKNCGG